MTPTQPRTVADSMVRAGKALLAERYGPKNAASIVAAIEEEAVGEYREALREVMEAAMWCDMDYRQTLASKPVLDVDELRAFLAAACAKARSLLDRSGVTDPAGEALEDAFYNDPEMDK